MSTNAHTATATHPRALSDAPSAAGNIPLLSTRVADTPASEAACTTAMTTAAASHSGESRSTARWARNAAASMTPRSSGRAVISTSTKPPRQTAPATEAVK